MTETVVYRINSAGVGMIVDHLVRNDSLFVPPLSQRVDIGEYGHKIARMATRFEAWAGSDLVGLAALYCNDGHGRAAYITSVSVDRDYQRLGLAAQLLSSCIAHARRLGFELMQLEVDAANASAIALYSKAGFTVQQVNDVAVHMQLRLGGPGAVEQRP
jgi:ribosomal protein S18 acetylase RimI-like enzyme